MRALPSNARSACPPRLHGHTARERGQESARKETADDWEAGGLGQSPQEESKAKRKEQEKKMKEADNEVKTLTRLLESAGAMATTREKHERAAKAAARAAENEVKEKVGSACAASATRSPLRASCASTPRP